MLIIQLSAIVALVVNSVTAKVFTKCELARELSEIHHIPSHEIGTYVCIAERQSGLNTQLVGQGLYYGMYQMSSEFWCDSYGYGKECNMNCNSLLDDDISDDLRCMKKIIQEHQRWSGNGFSAWPSGVSCQQLGNNYISECSIGSNQISKQQTSFTSGKVTASHTKKKKGTGKGKVYGRCELAKELETYGVPSHEIGTHVCIAERQSGLNTQAVGEGLYYGMYQISSEFWCGYGKACNINCNDLLDDDLSDDLQCMRTIIDEHQRLHGNGFSAWPSGTSCQSQGNNYIADCSSTQSNHVRSTYNNHVKKSPAIQGRLSGSGKVYERCELARELRDKHDIPMEHIAMWVCIAKHESNFNTSAIGRLNWDGSEDHGLFQISDLYWCGPTGKGCGLTCDELKDNDITNDVDCIKTIHAEHTRLSGDGFTAWTVYPRCKGQADSYINGCFDDSDNEIIPYKHQPGIQQPHTPNYSTTHHKSKASVVGKGKVYERCELARELRDTHKIPLSEIATWVCIAKHESNFNTSAIGRLNWDGSEDHGLFQISDIYWCGIDGKACDAQCSEFEDNDISDDVRCIRQIHAEHTRLSGDGFNAWTVYKPKCKGRSESFIKGCFDDSSNEILPFKPLPGIQQHNKVHYSKTSDQRKHYVKVPGKGKIYERCELAQELRYKHKIPMEQVATWVCIAKHESNFNTSAIGRLNWDGSEDHGLFQISDIYWCSPPGQGKGCGLSCAELEDNDISDDVECMLKIFEEHTLLSGDGFTAWTVYRPHCQGRSESFISGCFNGDDNIIHKPAVTQPTIVTQKKVPQTTQYVEPTTITEKFIDTTIYDTTTVTEQPQTTTTKTYTQSKTTLLPPKSVKSSPTVKPFNVFDVYFNSFSNSKRNNVTPQQKSIVVDKPLSSKQYSTKSYSSSTTKQPYRTYNDRKVPSSTVYSTNLPNVINLKNTSTTSKSIRPPTTSRTSIITTTARNLIAQTKQTTSKPKILQTKTIKGNAVQPFNVFSLYLNDFTSKAPPIVYKPIQFSDRSTVIFKKSENYAAPSASSSIRTTSTTERAPIKKVQTTKSSSFYNHFPTHYFNSGVNHNRIGRLITPHSIEYLLKLTTPRTIYG